MSKFPERVGLLNGDSKEEKLTPNRFNNNKKKLKSKK